jgi:hypothetical protein
MLKIWLPEKGKTEKGGNGCPLCFLLNEFSSDFQVGFFNEVGPVKLHNVKLI